MGKRAKGQEFAKKMNETDYIPKGTGGNDPPYMGGGQ
jgi:hypothetical protein